MQETESFLLAKKFLGKRVKIIIDRPLGSKHPKYKFIYECNYGYVPGTNAPDGEELDAYYLGISKPVKEAVGECIAVVHRLNDNDDKLVMVPLGLKMNDDEIEKAIKFHEKYFIHKLVR